ncbi:MAG: cytochrome C biogenesis protein CcdA [Marinosulfonomonas sp.]|nr:MAG: cytochrome C biogenesis protein CcdA [Marinosulfonomonas sp.]
MKRLLLILLLLASPAVAVQPDEILDDPVLEARARELSKGLRCLVCRNENIDESNADLARDLRILVRDRMLAGDDDIQAVAFIVDRYGEYVLLKPTLGGVNLILWIAGPTMFLGALGIGITYLRRRERAVPPENLSKDEKSRLDDLLNS